MTRYTAEQRQEIVEDFCRRHGGRYDPVLFLAEVKSQGSRHPAYDWFEFDRDAAAYEYNLTQARSFARDLRVVFEVVEVHPSGPIRIQRSMPLVLSPLTERHRGGGYFMTDPKNPQHVAELTTQATMALRAWLSRYGACLPPAGLSAETFHDILATLERPREQAKSA